MDILPIQIGRPLLNSAAIGNWAESLGVLTSVSTDLHVTIAYSKIPVDWTAKVFQAKTGKVLAIGGNRELKIFSRNLLVLTFESFDLSNRWQQFVDNGASWDFENYQPHITLGKTKANIVLSEIVPYDAELIFGPEYRKSAK